LAEVGTAKASKQATPTLTSWRAQSEQRVRARKEGERARVTHLLESAYGGTNQDSERKQESEGHSHTGEPEERASQDIERKQLPVGEGRSQTEERREGRIRTAKASKQARGTHSLENADDTASQDAKEGM